MRIFHTTTLTSILLCALVGSALGQGMSKRGGSGDITEALIDFFGNDTAFSATAHVSMKSPAGADKLTLDMKFAVLDGNVRTETEMTKVKGTPLPPDAIVRMKQMGMDRTVHLYLSGKHLSYLIYPDMKSYCEIPMKADGTSTNKQPAKVDRAELGKETIDGHPSIKYQVTVTPAEGKPSKALIWRATDLNDYPVQVEMTLDDSSVVTTTFQNINQTKPAPALFELPTDYTKYDSIQDLMMKSMQRMMGAIGQ